MSAKPQRRGFVLQLQIDGALVLQHHTTSAQYAVEVYRKYLDTALARRGMVIVLHDEREITGAQLRAIAKESTRA